VETQLTEEQILDFANQSGRPYLVVSQYPEVECCKCGGKMPAPGRMAYYDGVTVRYWCDCVTELEMGEVALQLDALVKFCELQEVPCH